MRKAPSWYFKKIGALGGKSRSEKKIAATRQNVLKAQKARKEKTILRKLGESNAG